ncbi:MAG: PQQ-dependent sugar dehydrogenase [Firmicutes bacterium]|nr:PQQ-dependent sugar dehydrogenase [Bacillota bacterium]
MEKRWSWASALSIMAVIAACLYLFAGCAGQTSPITTTTAKSTVTTQGGKERARKPAFPQTITGLNQPIAMAFTPDRRIFITERIGRIRVFANHRLLRKPFATVNVPQLSGYNETGLLGIALHPNFQAQPYVYIYHTYVKNGRLTNRVVRFKENESNTAAPEPEVIVDNIPGGRIHNGGILAFGPDGNLYISTGETGNRSLAQDISSTAGKILRVRPDGKIPDDNPFKNSPVYSYGHRNVFGMAFDPKTKALYITENGPTRDDEINRIVKGGNYGWPIVLGKSNDKRFINPLIVYRRPIAPTQAIFYTGNIFPKLKDWFIFGTYNTDNLHAIELTSTVRDQVRQDKVIYQAGSSIIGIAQSPDGDIYVIESNIIRKLNQIKDNF